jgi:hypothetical protein
MNKIVSKESLAAMLADPAKRSKVIGRALVALLARQVDDEQVSADTRYHNGIGFAPCDAYSGTLTAKYFRRHGSLLDWQVDKWMQPSGASGNPRLLKYSRQLNEIANEKALSA